MLPPSFPPTSQVLEAPHHDATSAFKQTFRRQLGVNEVDATEISACSSTTKATVVFPFVEEIYKKVSDDMFTVRACVMGWDEGLPWGQNCLPTPSPSPTPQSLIKQASKPGMP